MLAKLAGDAQLAGVGIIDPFAEHRGRPLADHLDDFARYLAAKGDTAGHVRQTRSRTLAVLEGCRFKVLGDLQPAAVVEFLAGLRLDSPAAPLDSGKEWYTYREAAPLLGLSAAATRNLAKTGPLPGPPPRRQTGQPSLLHRDTVAGLVGRRSRGLGTTTTNHYLGSVKRFTRWLARERRAPFDPLAHLSALNPRADLRHPRRPLDGAEFARLVEATGGGKPHRGLTGAQRLILYCVSARTGLRADELASLTPRSLDLDARPPSVTVEACYSKHRRKDVLPLRADVAQMLRAYVEGRPRGEPLWPGKWWEDAAVVIRRDLAAAGIPYEDEDGRVFDFHALRHTFLTHLAESGVHPKVAQVLARHSTITLTMDRYTHMNALDVAGDLDKLPDLPLPAPAGAKPGAGGKARTRRQRA
jgi:integrase